MKVTKETKRQLIVMLGIIFLAALFTMCMQDDTFLEEDQDFQSETQSPEAPGASNPQFGAHMDKRIYQPDLGSDDRMFGGTDEEVIPDPLERVVNPFERVIDEVQEKK